MAKDMKFKENYPDYRQTLAQISLEMGHSRTEITRHYLVGNF